MSTGIKGVSHRTGRYRGHMTINTTSWVRAYISNADLYELGMRAKALGVKVVVDASSARGPFQAKAYTDGTEWWKHTDKTPYEAIEGALDRYEATLWTADELVQIASQSGIGVQRA